jgi:hypothetical protein
MYKIVFIYLILSYKNTIIVLNDTNFTKGWRKRHPLGPTKTWIEHIQEVKDIYIQLQLDSCFF